ncbi:MAG: low-complexity tail membrane protein [Limnothrix sp.]
MVIDPYLWLHFSGLAMLPLTLALVAIALPLGIPLPFSIGELVLIVLLGGVPVWTVQILRPWNPFSCWIFQIPPERLDERQKQLLRLIQGTRQPLFNVLGAVVMVVLLWQIAHYSPLAVGAVGGFWQWRIVGLALATVGFFLSNIFLQIPLTLLPTLLLSEETVTAIDPHPDVSIRRDFACWGLPMGQLFPSFPSWRR